MEYVIEQGAPPKAVRAPKNKNAGLSGAIRGLERGQFIRVPGKKRIDVASRASNIARTEGDGRVYATRVIDGAVHVYRTA